MPTEGSLQHLQLAISTPHFPCKALADALKSNRTVTSIYLEGNEIGDDGAKARRCSWRGLCSLQFQTRISPERHSEALRLSPQSTLACSQHFGASVDAAAIDFKRKHRLVWFPYCAQRCTSSGCQGLNLVYQYMYCIMKYPEAVDQH